MPTNHLGRFLTIAVVLLGALFAIFPEVFTTFYKNPAVLTRPLDYHNLKPGIDMVGGTSLLYEIKVPEGATADPELSTHVMDALKKRVDPEGVRNLVWRPQGSTRLEIQMPRTGKGQGTEQIREAFAKAQAELEATNLRMGSVEDAVRRLKGAARDERLAVLASDSPARKAAFATMAKAYDAIQAAKAKQDAAVEAAAELEYEAAKKQVEQTILNVAQLESALTEIETAKAKQAADPKADAPSPELTALVAKVEAGAKDFPAQAAALKNYIAAHAAFFSIKSQLDDAADLKRLLQGSGVLEYHITVPWSDPRVAEMIGRLDSGAGTAQRAGDTAKWVQVDKPETMPPTRMGEKTVVRDYLGRRWVLLDIRPEKSMTQQSSVKWALKSVERQNDPHSGEPHVAFQLDTNGGYLMGKLTGANIGNPMAMVLDEKVISAPNIQSQINESGQITGHYTASEIRYLVSTLNAGSLPAQLAEEPISERTVGPQLGADNLRSGFLACGVGLVVVGIFLISYYYLSGVVAYIAVVLNLVLILGALAALQATFTLPGVAALVLTLGTAVDANVLIFERLREEQARGFPIRTALKHSYERAFGAIFDSNVVTAITSLVLYLFGSEEVKGFGLTLLIGIVASLFTSLYVTKTLFAILVDKFGVKKLGSFPTSFPTWDRALKPNINWLKFAYPAMFATLAVVFLGLGLFVKYIKAGEMFDIEFSSGTAVTIELKEPMRDSQVRELLNENANKEVLVASRESITAGTTQPSESGVAAASDRKVTVATAIPSPSIVAVGLPGPNGNTSFEIVTPNTDVPAVRSAIFATFSDRLQLRLPSTFARVGTSVEGALNQVIFPVTATPPVGRFVPEQWGEHTGGVAIYLDNISPPLSAEEIEARITSQKLQPGAAAAGLPSISVFSPVARTEKTSEAVVMAVDQNISAEEDQEKWSQEIVTPLWKLVNEAISAPPSLAKVSNFDAQVAGEMQRDAFFSLTLAIGVIMAYIWIRFGDLRFGLANTAALLHDTIAILAALGFSHFIWNAAPGFAEVIKVEPFRINLTIVAGILTVMGYSMVDTIVVFDRIRELRGKTGTLNRKIINDALNQTLSRTLLTAGTTVATLAVMYWFGGSGIHGFTYILLVGILVGTYSSIVIAAPLLLLGLKQPVEKPARESTALAATKS